MLALSRACYFAMVPEGETLEHHTHVWAQGPSQGCGMDLKKGSSRRQSSRHSGPARGGVRHPGPPFGTISGSIGALQFSVRCLGAELQSLHWAQWGVEQFPLAAIPHRIGLIMVSVVSARALYVCSIGLLTIIALGLIVHFGVSASWAADLEGGSCHPRFAGRPLLGIWEI